ncbi:MAG: hypothetical protein V7K18_15030 [Nostoc sp.]|uniref:hypothetical protein n=1 Tax=Nostoc sp. TaxID=1180 RepID=UPI002FF8C292
MTKIRFQLAPKPTKAEIATQGIAGFVPIAYGGRVRHRNSLGEENARMLGWNDVRVGLKTLSELWLMRQSSLNLCFIRLMLKRLAQA